MMDDDTPDVPGDSGDLLKAIVRFEGQAAQSGELESARQAALDHYHGRPYGDEEDGRSHIVMRDVADTVEWIKPSLLKIFAAGDEVVTFNPVGPEDEQAAEQETDYVNHLLMTKNDGFLILHDWMHDALLQKNGYVMVRASKKVEQTKERFEKLSDDEFTALMQSPEVELVEHAEHEMPVMTTMGPQMATYHDAVVKQARDYTCIEVINVAPERVLVHKDWSALNLRDCPFVEVIDYQTISSLRQMGYDVEDDINDSSTYNEDEWSQMRRQVEQDGTIPNDDGESGPIRTVKVRYVWIRFDADDDGIAELIRCVVVGDQILEQEEDDLIPVACLCPYRVPHEHVGMSVDDVVEDLQRIRTVLVRGLLDSHYMAMHPQTYVDTTRVNLDDMMVNRVGGVRRVNGNPNDAVREIPMPDTGGSTMQGIEYIDSVRENRTGVTKYNQGLDANSLNKTAHGISQIMSASQQRIELVARLMAETGVKSLMLILHAMSIKHGRQSEMLRLRGKWVPVDPRQWKTRSDMSVTVGIGTGNKDQMLQHLMMILAEQKQGLQLGLANPANIYSTLKRLTQNAGFRQVEEFWADPAQQPPQPPPDPMQSPEMLKVSMQEQNKYRMKLLDLAADVLKAQATAGMMPQMDFPQMVGQIDQMAQQMGPM